MSRIQITFLSIGIMLLNGLQNVAATNTEEAEQLSELMTQKICEDAIYLECINLSRTKCTNTMQEATNICPRIYIESLDIEMTDAPCITNKFFEIAKIPVATAKFCDELIKPAPKP